MELKDIEKIETYMDQQETKLKIWKLFAIIGIGYMVVDLLFYFFS